MDKKTETMTEQELERAADELLAASEIKDAPKKKSTRRAKTEEKPAEEPVEVKTTEDILNELMEKAKKSGKITTKEIATLEEKRARSWESICGVSEISGTSSTAERSRAKQS